MEPRAFYAITEIESQLVNRTVTHDNILNHIIYLLHPRLNFGLGAGEGY